MSNCTSRSSTENTTAPRFVFRLDEAIAAGRLSGSPTRLIAEVQEELGEPAGAVSIADLFRSQGDPAGFAMIGAPGALLQAEPQPGDILCRRGEGGLVHAAVIAGSDFWPRELVERAGLVAEGGRPGIYAPVVEGGALPHGSHDRFARLLTDSTGRVPANQMLLRPLREAAIESAETVQIGGEYVRWIQQSLNQVLGTQLAADGILSPNSVGAIRRFQRERRLVVDGIVGPMTERALIGAGAPPPPPRPGQFPLRPGPSSPTPPPGSSTEPRIDPRDERVDVSAKFALERMMRRSDMRRDAIQMISAINAGKLAGIFGDDLQAAVRLAQRHGTQRWLLVPQGEDGALVLDPADPLTASPTIIFRRLTRNTAPGKAIDPSGAVPVRAGNEFGVADPSTGQVVLTRDLPPNRLEAALQKAAQTFELWQSGRLRRCELPDGPAALGASVDAETVLKLPANLFPPILCQLGDGGTKPGDTVEVNGPPAPSPIALPPFQNAGPKTHPALPTECQAGLFFGVPPTQKTRGTLLSPAEVARRRSDIAAAITRARATRPLSAAHLEHWLDRSGTLLKMATRPFQNIESRVPEFLADRARPEFENGITARLKNRAHPQGTLLPASSAVGSVGPVRFLQFRSGIRPTITGSGVGADLATALGAFLVHSAIWVQAKITKKTGGVLGIGEDTVFEVTILRWCVQVYDAYDWNLGSSTPIPVPVEAVKDIVFPPEAVTVTPGFVGFVVVVVKDQYFRDLEVSGGGKAFLAYTEPFAAPASIAVPFTITI